MRKAKVSERPKCHNRPEFKSFAQGQIGWTEDGRRIMAHYPDDMSKGCASIKPPFGEAIIAGWDCSGCRWMK